MTEGRILQIGEALDVLDDHFVGDAFLTKQQRADLVATSSAIEAIGGGSPAELVLTSMIDKVWNGDQNA